ncbi:hypothetical protein FJZ36_13580 [Candidatus Poribacteria bacterium]|nr:hypothetical protein [Candidatus Poribacteria bacterium]
MNTNRQSPRPGDIWFIRTYFVAPWDEKRYETPEPVAVVIVRTNVGFDTLGGWVPAEAALHDALPVSFAVDMQGRYDLRVDQCGSPLGSACIVETGLPMWVMSAQLERKAGELDEEAFDDLCFLYDAARGLFYREKDEWANALLDGMDLPAASYDGDPRIAFRERELGRIRPLADAVSAFSDWYAAEDARRSGAIRIAMKNAAARSEAIGKIATDWMKGIEDRARKAIEDATAALASPFRLPLNVQAASGSEYGKVLRDAAERMRNKEGVEVYENPDAGVYARCLSTDDGVFLNIATDGRTISDPVKNVQVDGLERPMPTNLDALGLGGEWTGLLPIFYPEDTGSIVDVEVAVPEASFILRFVIETVEEGAVL